MDRRDFKSFITKRSSIWTISLCMTGIIVLGGVAAINNSRRDDTEVETELGELAYMEEDGNEALFDTLDEDIVDEGTEEGIAANADGNEAVNADGTASDESAVNADGAADESAVSADGTAADTGAAANADGTAVSADGSAAEEASSAGIISEQALLDAGVSFGEESSLMWPSAGTILIDYSMDSSVYFPTLNQYKYNPALIIGSEVGNQVLASAKGIVESVDIDDETGTTLVLNIGNGYKLTYGQLKELAVAQGDVVEAGTVLGYVSEPTKYYSTEGSNLYFKMTQDETPVDPVLYLE